MINIVAEGSSYENQSADEYLSGESVSVTLTHALELIMEAEKRVDLIRDELLSTLNPERRLKRKNLDSTPTNNTLNHWLDRF